MNKVEKFNDDHDPASGQFTGPGGDGSGGGGGGDGKSPKVLSNGKGTSTAKINKVKAAVKAIPAAHADKISHVDVNVVGDNTQLPSGPHSGGDRKAVGMFSYGGGSSPTIHIPQNFLYRGSDGKTFQLPLKTIERDTVHELGHALDHNNNWEHSKSIKAEVQQGMARLKSKEAEKAGYLTQDPHEAFAELYALAHNPNKSGSQKYFGGMSKARAETVFKEALEKVKAIK
jgi:hypothetical protein